MPTVVSQISLMAHDFDVRWGTFSNSGTNLNLNGQYGGAGKCGFYLQLNVPQGEEINNAYLDLKANWANAAAVSSSPLSCTIAAENVDNATLPSTTAALNAKSLTSAVGITVPVSASWGTVCLSTDFASVVQAVVDRPGWVSGNYILLVTSGTHSGEAQYQSRDLSTPNAPKLSVTYGEGGEEPPVDRSYYPWIGVSLKRNWIGPPPEWDWIGPLT